METEAEVRVEARTTLFVRVAEFEVFKALALYVDPDCPVHVEPVFSRRDVPGGQAELPCVLVRAGGEVLAEIQGMASTVRWLLCHIHNPAS